MYAASVVLRARRENFPKYLSHYLRPGELDWMFNKKTVEILAREINVSTHYWDLDKLPSEIRELWKCPDRACACTPPSPAKETHFSVSYCSGRLNRAEVAPIVVQTTLHRLPEVLDSEDKAYRISTAFFATWTNMGHADFLTGRE